MKTLFVSLSVLFAAFLVSGCNEDSSGGGSASSASSSEKKKSKVREGFRLTAEAEGLFIQCQTAPKNMSSPTYGDLAYQLDIMGGWINPSAPQGQAKFGLGTMFIVFEEAKPGTYSLVPFQSESGVRMKIDSIADLGLANDLFSISGEVIFEKIEVGENGKPEVAQGSYSGEFAKGDTGETISLTGDFAIGLSE